MSTLLMTYVSKAEEGCYFLSEIFRRKVSEENSASVDRSLYYLTNQMDDYTVELS